MSLSRVLNGIGFRVNRTLYGYDPNGFYQKGDDVFQKDWDVLALLDACRADVFRERSNLPGRTSSIVSRGSSTGEWYRGNVNGRDLTDTVAVGASPAIRHENHRASFHAIDNVWQDAWNSQLCTVPPDTTTDRALKAASEYPDKRIFIHYLQPHYPFIGPTGREFTYDGYESPIGSKTKFWHQYGFRRGDATDDELWEAYLENVDIALKSVDRLRRNVKGKVVITADHGSLIGQRAGIIPVKRYGHPPGFHVDALLDVPWHEFPADARRDVTASPPENEHEQADENTVEQRLVDLGYVTSG